jgi:hypothetical protein
MANLKYVLTIDGKQFRFQEDQTMGNYTLTLEKLSYDKGIYRPAEMKVTINVGGQGVKNNDLVSAFHQKPVQLTINGETVADSYFVFKVMPIFKKVSNGSNVKLELTIYSLDKLLAIDKYSKAWTGKKLGVDIFTKEVESFKLQVPTKCDLQVVEYNKEVGTDEFVQPYLVQYNESFYDFMRRTANRCGEFLYHENGQLHLGMQMTDKAGNSDPDYAQIASERYYETLLQEGVETSSYSYNYLEGHTAPNNDQKSYSNPLGTDDYLDEVKAEYTDWQTQMDYLSTNLMNCISMLLGNTTLAALIGDGVTHYTFRVTQAIVAVKNLNDKNEETNIDPWANKSDQKSGDTVRQFGTMKDQKPKNNFCGKDINMNAEFYGLMREAEKKVGENAVYLDFGDDTQKLSIGDKIKVDGEYYVVIGVNGSCEFKEATGLLSSPTYDERQQVIGVKLYGEVAIPPALPDIVIRESQPQLAFVADNFDPEKLGRVRVKFAWQPKEGDDNKENASPWIRVSLPFATDGAGVKFKPEKGDEVMVSFEEGNVERPYVSGFLLSPSCNKKWGWLPDKSITSTNGHSITFNDGIDGSSFFQGLIPGLKMIRSYWPTSDFPPLLQDVDWCRGMTGGMTISDRMGLYKIDLNSSSRSVLIQSSMGNVKIDAFTGISISAPNGDIKIEGKNIKLEASDTISIESGTAVKHRYLPGDTPYTEGNARWNTPAGRWAADIGLSCFRGLRKRIVDSAIDVNLIRTAIDVFLRPIDGTTKIRSNTYMRIEAGKGSTEYPRDAREIKGKALVAPQFFDEINAIASLAKTRVGAVQTSFVKLCSAISAFNTVSGKNGENADEAVIKFDDILKASYKAESSALTYNWDEKLKDIPTEESVKKSFDDQLKALADKEPKFEDDKYQKLGRADGLDMWNKDRNNWKKERQHIKNECKKALEDRNKSISEKKKPIEDAAKNLSYAIKLYYKATKVFFCSPKNNGTIFKDAYEAAISKLEFKPELTITKTTNENSIPDWNNLKKHYMRTAVSLFLSEANVADKVNNRFLMLSAPAATASKDQLEDEVNWMNLVNSMVSNPVLPKATGDMVKEWFEDTYGKLSKGEIGNRHRWKVGVEGKILLSDNSDKTLTFDQNGMVHTTENVTFTKEVSDHLKRVLASIGTNVE